MLIKTPSYVAAGHGLVLSLRCPGCRQIGTFEAFKEVNDLQTSPHLMGQRRCPNPACRAQVFFVYSTERKNLVLTYPAERIDFDTTDIPQEICSSLEEAITCHAAQCFRASAIMVRRTLEELCKHRGATGATLKARIAALGTKVVLPQELLDALTDLRLLGNDAAHLESQEYNDVGQAEVEAGIALAKEVLKALYQYSALVKQLKALKKAP